MTGSSSRSHGPWVDLHAHPGRCFLAGLPDDDVFCQFLGAETCRASLEDIERTGLAAVSFSTVADLVVLGLADDGGLRATRPFNDGEAYADHRRQLAALENLARRHGATIVRRAEDIVRAHEDGTSALLFACEGADFVEDHLERLEECHDAGVRSITLVHYRQNDYGDLQTEELRHGGLSGAGREVVREMNRLGLLIDLAHATFETTRGVLEESDAPITISHTHLRAVGREHPRLISAEHAREVASAGGLIGVWPAGVASRTLEDYLDEIIRMIEVVGVRHVGVGTDMDANFRPVMDRHGQFRDLDERLLARGLTRVEVDQVLGGNAVELLRAVCG